MRRSRNEVSRWRMQRQSVRRRRRWLENHSRRNLRIFSIRKIDIYARRQSLLFIQWME
nr:YciY family protein [uncultured Moellerella sp.]